MEIDKDKLVYTVREVAKMLGVSTATAYEQCSCGHLPTLKIGRRVLIPRAAFDKFLNSKTEEFEQRLKDRDYGFRL